MTFAFFEPLHRINFSRVNIKKGIRLTTKPLEDVVQGHSDQVKDLIEAQKVKPI